MSWTLRLLLEQTAHISTDFITLTYSEDRVPDRLDPKHFELYIERLRRDIRAPVRYFCCGEYGGKTMRPHWHVLLFGHRYPARGLFHAENHWEHGHLFSEEFNQTTAAYVARYNLKTCSFEDKPQILRMSRRPGIGLDQLRSIAAKFARAIPQMAYYPPILNFAGRSWWLDRHAYDSSVTAYLEAGGHLTSELPPPPDMLPHNVDARSVDREVMSWARSQKGKL